MITAFLPCRAGSVRVPNKNTKPFFQNEDGLVGRKIKHLLASKKIDAIIVSTDDPTVMSIVDRYQSVATKPLTAVERPLELSVSGDLDAFVAYVPTLIPNGTICWVHATSPFFDGTSIDRACGVYGDVRHSYDSLMGVTKIQDFFWRHGDCISHDRSRVKWPQTQDIDPFYEVNSTIFMIESELMRSKSDRIGDRPFLFETTKQESFDVDWEDDFEMMDLLVRMEDLKARGRAY